MEHTVNVIGIPHSKKDSGYQQVMGYVQKTIQTGERVAIESPWGAERIEREGAAHRDPQYQFLYDLYIELRKKQAQIFPVEDEELYALSGNFKQWYMFEEPEVLEADDRWQELSIKRSIRHLQLAQERACRTLFTGRCHAAELSMMGYAPVTFVPPDPECERLYRKEMKPYIERFGVDLSTGEWKRKVYGLVSDMTLKHEEK